MDADKKASEIRERKTHVLFVCTHNSARSQIGEGYLRAHYGDFFEVGSAGTEVRGVNPAAIAMMEEIGINLSGHRSKLIDEFFDQGVDIVITVCDSAHQACPFFPGARTIIHVGFLILQPVPEPQENVSYRSGRSGTISLRGSTRFLCRITDTCSRFSEPVPGTTQKWSGAVFPKCQL
jgi:arsenate reductase (thioredoxin)